MKSTFLYIYVFSLLVCSQSLALLVCSWCFASMVKRWVSSLLLVLLCVSLVVLFV